MRKNVKQYVCQETTIHQKEEKEQIVGPTRYFKNNIFPLFSLENIIYIELNWYSEWDGLNYRMVLKLNPANLKNNT